ncbi:MAG: hypothetical protein A2X01_00285 [Bacteroidetes bacterium GWF2_35_48]|nr:MAG: hypothetical protein A2X01_00285 [Bacteroidetes bacterium GWF2_35_48]OFZ01418.1 MAG: hypothetical protein A2491_19705 [Bacteroidetes bacterium RIFOXYC12_FULL_35_7]
MAQWICKKHDRKFYAEGLGVFAVCLYMWAFAGGVCRAKKDRESFAVVIIKQFIIILQNDWIFLRRV